MFSFLKLSISKQTSIDIESIGSFSCEKRRFNTFSIFETDSIYSHFELFELCTTPSGGRIFSARTENHMKMQTITLSIRLRGKADWIWNAIWQTKNRSDFEQKLNEKWTKEREEEEKNFICDCVGIFSPYFLVKIASKFFTRLVNSAKSISNIIFYYKRNFLTQLSL